MLSKFRSRLTYANVMATIAVFLALGGGAYAAFKLPKNSVGTKQIKTGAVTPKKLAPSTKRLLRGQQGARGDTGPQGARGDTGQTGNPGPSDVYAAGAGFGALTATYTQVAVITVPAGSYLLGGKTTILAHAADTSAIADCVIATTIAAGSGTFDQGSAVLPVFTGQTSREVISLAGAATFDSQQTVVLACKTNAGTADYSDARVWATKTGSLHGAPLPID
jgi:hypothetical protein